MAQTSEDSLKSDLSAFLYAVAAQEAPGNAAFRQTVAETAEGVIHLQKNGIPWIEAAFSLQHVVQGDCLALVLGAKACRVALPTHRSIRTALKIHDDVRESSLNLPIANPGEGSYTRAYAWMRAALFMVERRHKARFDDMKNLAMTAASI